MMDGRSKAIAHQHAKLGTTPECDKILASREDAHTIGQFLEWLTENGYRVDLVTQHSQQSAYHLSIENLLERYFEIDQERAECERRAILEACREENEERRNV